MNHAHLYGHAAHPCPCCDGDRSVAVYPPPDEVETELTCPICAGSGVVACYDDLEIADLITEAARMDTVSTWSPWIDRHARELGELARWTVAMRAREAA